MLTRSWVLSPDIEINGCRDTLLHGSWAASWVPAQDADDGFLVPHEDGDAGVVVAGRMVSFDAATRPWIALLNAGMYGFRNVRL
ncbi:hypothetical protein NDU88_004211 [Pleurodeles waltl]|uniref:Uncharacterized protein n=1 Tax=Pleurodeles waltl TaxID=8319 RepID=A0AAV7QF96_PLEWA|nr:hypothetical protein NDU88_004211 [Pleurodeles waltl]